VQPRARVASTWDHTRPCGRSCPNAAGPGWQPRVSPPPGRFVAVVCAGAGGDCEGSDGGPAATRTWTTMPAPRRSHDQQPTSGAWNKQCCTAQTMLKRGRRLRSFSRHQIEARTSPTSISSRHHHTPKCLPMSYAGRGHFKRPAIGSYGRDKPERRRAGRAFRGPAPLCF